MKRPLWLRIVLPIGLALLVLAIIRFAVPPLYAELRHPNNVNVFDEMYYSGRDADPLEFGYYLPLSKAELIENMNGLKSEYDGFPRYGYPRQATASPGQLYCPDNEHIRIGMPKGTVLISYGVYFENEIGCLQVMGWINYDVKQKQLTIGPRSYELSTTKVETEAQSPLPGKRWTDWTFLDSDKGGVRSLFDISEDVLSSHEEYIIDKVVDDFISSNSGKLPYSADYWGSINGVQPEFSAEN